MAPSRSRRFKWVSPGALAALLSLLPSSALAQAEGEAAAEAPPPADPEPAAPAPAPEAEAETEAPAAELNAPAPSEGAAADASEGVVVEGGSLFEQGAPETEETTGDVGSAAGPALRFELNGYVRGDAYFGKADDSNASTLKAGYGELALQLRVKPEQYGDAFADFRVKYGQEGDVYGQSVDLAEAYVNTYLGPVDLRLGKQIIVWGRADAFNPTNNINPVDLTVRSPNEDDRRVGLFGARMFINFAPFKLEGVWMPSYVPTKLPPIQLEPEVTVLDPVLPGPELENGLGAGRLHLELASFEASVSYLYGHALLPGIDLISYDVFTNAQVTVQRRVFHQEVIGADFSTAIGDLVAVRGEAAYKAPINYEANYTPNREISYALGLDRAFGSLNVIAQYLGKYVLDWQDYGDPKGIEQLENTRPEDLEVPATRERVERELNNEIARRNQTLFQQTEELQHIASVRLEYLALNDTLSLSALGLYNFSTSEWLLFPKISYKFTDGLSGAVGAEIYNGPDYTLLDYLDQELTAGYAELKYAF
jgi:hypothetical protein